MRKLLLSVAIALFMTGIVVAAEVTVVRYDKDTDTVTVKEGTAEKAYKITDATKVVITDKEGKETAGKVDDLKRRLAFVKEGGKRQMKLDITTEGDKITKVKMRGFGGKRKKD